MNLQERLTEQLDVDEVSTSDGEGDEPFCPECGQSLDLARLQETPVKRRTLEPFVLLVFGLCLTAAFGLRAWDTLTQLSSLDQQTAALGRAVQGTFPKPGNPSMIVADTMSEVLSEQAALQVGLQRDLTGLGLGTLHDRRRSGELVARTARVRG